jgi:hypothetical protein
MTGAQARNGELGPDEERVGGHECHGDDDADLHRLQDDSAAVAPNRRVPGGPPP